MAHCARNEKANRVKRCVAFAGGGSGGHLYPALAIAEKLHATDADIDVVFWGSGRDLERRIVTPSGYRYAVVSSSPLPSLRRNPITFAWRNIQGVRSARKLIRTQRPAVVVGCGGFASAPGVLAAALSRIPIVLLEQNSYPGRATKFLSRFATTICLSFAESRGYLPTRSNCRVTGNPVREAIAELADQQHERSKTLLVLGGSQGARGLNESVPVAVARIGDRLDGWRIVHQAGAEHVETVRLAYRQSGVPATVEPFFDDMPALYRETSLVISRAGATTLAELACAGIPAILVPYPHAADRHQHHNAATFVEAGAAVCVEESPDSAATAASVANALARFLGDDGQRQSACEAMHKLARPDAANAIYTEIQTFLGRRR